MDERFTNFYVDYNIEDTTAKEDASFSTTDSQQQQTNIDRLIYKNTEVSSPYFSFEHNFNILNGTNTEMPVDPNNAYTFINATLNQNSILFVESTDGTILVNSTSEVPIEHNPAYYSRNLALTAGTWYISGCPLGGSDDTYCLEVNNGEYKDYGDGVSITLNAASTVNIRVKIASDFYAYDVLFTPIVSQKEGPYVTDIIPYFNTQLSDINGEYDTDPKFVIDFTREHASYAFMMQFIDAHPLKARLTFYNLDDEILKIVNIDIKTNLVLIPEDVFGYAKIIVEFPNTLPQHYVKMKSFYFGVMITWDETNVKEGTIVQETDRISKVLSIDTLSFRVIDVTNDLNLGNVDGMHKYFQKNQYMLPYEIVNGKKIRLGKYYLKTFSESSNLGKMTAQSYVGIMDDNMFYEGEVYNGKIAGEVIEQIFEVLGLTDYTIDNETYNQPLYGTITPKSCRKALNEILFACNSIINSHDMDNIIIKKTSQIRRPDIPRDSKFSTTVTKNDYTYGVEVKYTTYTKEEESKEIARGEYAPGNYTVYFTQPYTDLSITGATITTARPYYVQFAVASEGEVVISGYAYSTVQNTVNATQPKLLAGEEEKFATYTTNLCNMETSIDLAKKLLTYLNLNLTIKIKWLADGNDMNDFHIVQNPNEDFNDYSAVFTKRTLDLTGGFIDTATMAGKSILDDYYKYTKEEEEYELYTGEEGVI
jgi:hypothetical protein